MIGAFQSPPPIAMLEELLWQNHFFSKLLQLSRKFLLALVYCKKYLSYSHSLQVATLLKHQAPKYMPGNRLWKLRKISRKKSLNQVPSQQIAGLQIAAFSRVFKIQKICKIRFTVMSFFAEAGANRFTTE